MGRPRKQTVDYFPHFVNAGSKTKFILEQNWKNDGYAFWFKLLELLGRSEGHYYDCSNRANETYLVALMQVDKETATDILATLAELGNIDKELWEERKVIWCQSLVDNLQDVYSKRTVSMPVKPFSEELSGRKSSKNGETEAEKEQEEKLIKRRRPKRTEDGQPSQKGICEEIAEFYNKTCISFPHVRSLSETRKKAIKARLASGYTVENFEELFRKAEASSFLKGKNDRNWQATFDWLIKDSNMAKVIDGNYTDKGGSRYGTDRGHSQQPSADPGGFKPSEGFKENG